MRPDRFPQGLGGSGVAGVDEPGLAVMHDEATRGHRVGHSDRRHQQIADHVLDALAERAVPDGRRARRNHGKIRPDDVVEHGVLHGVDDRRQAGDRHPLALGAAGDGLGEECQPGDVVQVAMRDERVVDLELFPDRERGGHRAAVDQDPVVDEKGRGAVRQPFPAERPENPDLHVCSRILA